MIILCSGYFGFSFVEHRASNFDTMSEYHRINGSSSDEIPISYSWFKMQSCSQDYIESVIR